MKRLLTSTLRIFMAVCVCASLGMGFARAENETQPVTTESTVPKVTPMLTMGKEHVLLLRTDATIVGWGSNSHKQLAIADPLVGEIPKYVDTRPIAIEELGTVFRVKQVEASSFTSYVVTESGDLYSWGDNSEGQLGVPELVDDYGFPVAQNSKPTKVMSGVSYVSASDNYVLALSDGKVYGWGNNAAGTVGAETVVTYRSPILIEGLTDIVKISAASRYAMAVTSGGVLYAWGTNTFGQLGTGTSGDVALTPVQVVSGGVKDVYTTDDGVALVMVDGTMWVCGLNTDNRFGAAVTTGTDGSVAYEPSFTEFTNTTSAVKSVALADNFSIVLRTSGALEGCGNNTFGQLGNGTRESGYVFTQLIRDLTFTSVVANNNAAMAVSDGGYVIGWGANDNDCFMNSYSYLTNNADINERYNMQKGDSENDTDASYAIRYYITTPVVITTAISNIHGVAVVRDDAVGTAATGELEGKPVYTPAPTPVPLKEHKPLPPWVVFIGVGVVLALLACLVAYTNLTKDKKKFKKKKH